MKKFLVAFLTIALLAAMMAIPAAAAEPVSEAP